MESRRRSLHLNFPSLKSKRSRRWAVVLAITVLASYMILGAAAFFILENRAHEHRVRRWYLNMALERRQFARTISRRIFNDTKQLLIIIDRDQSEKVQAHLVSALKEYEELLDLQLPDRTDWNLQNSINYILAMLTTVGNGNRLPETTSGQDPNAVFKRRVVQFQIFLAIFFAWIFLIAFYVAYFVPDVNFRSSIYIAVFSALTIQTPYYHKYLGPLQTLVVLLMILMALSVKMILLFLLVSLYDGNKKTTRSGKVNDCAPEQPKLKAVVDSYGDTKLVQ